MMNIKALRKKQRMTQNELASSIGVDQSTVAKWETGKSYPRGETLEKLAADLGCTIDELYGRNLTVRHKPFDWKSTRKENNTMNATLEIDPALLDAAVQIMQEAQNRYEAEACALCVLASPEARTLAQARLESAALAGRLVELLAGS